MYVIENDRAKNDSEQVRSDPKKVVVKRSKLKWVFLLHILYPRGKEVVYLSSMYEMHNVLSLRWLSRI
jgi:hypothetical protein